MMTLETIKEFLNHGWAGSLIGLISILVSFFISLYFYFKSRERKCLSYAVRSLVVLDKEEDMVLNDVDILFKKKSISRLVRTVICIWNDGTKSIKKNEVLKPIYLDFFDAKVLNAKILKKSRDVCEIKIHSENTKVLFGFLILEHGDGVTIEIIHTSRIIHPLVEGVIEGVPLIKGGLFYSLTDILVRISFEVIIAIFLIVLIWLIIPSFIINSYIRVILDLIITFIFFGLRHYSDKSKWHLSKSRTPEKLFPYELKEFLQQDLSGK